MRKGIVKLTNLVNAIFSLKQVPSILKVAEVIMVVKPGKPFNAKRSCWPIYLLTTISKLFQKRLFRRLKDVIEFKNVIPNLQFGFR